MDYQASIVLFAKEEAPSFLRMVGPLLVIIGLVVFRWLGELAKKKERQQQAEEEAQREQEAQGGSRQARPSRPGVHSARHPPERVRSRRSEPIHRYQPEIPAGSPQQRQRDWRAAASEEPELAVLAEDISPDLAELARQRLGKQGERQLRAQAIRQAKAQQAQRRQQAAARRARLAAEKAAQQKRARALHDGKVDTGEKVVPQPSGVFLPLTAAKSPAQLRQAIVWAEILGAPLALRGQQRTIGY